MSEIKDAVSQLFCTHFQQGGATSEIYACVSNSTILSILGHNNNNELVAVCAASFV